MKYSIIIPVYNEANNIPIIIKKICKLLNKSRKTYEIIFVDDDSKDNSFNVFKKFKNKKTKFLKRIKKPRDLSKSVVYGFQRAKYNNFVVMDGDLQHSPEDLRKLMRLFEQKNCDIIFGSRKLISYKKNNLSPLRFYASKLLNSLTNSMFGYNFKDPMSGFFIVKKNIFLKSKNKLFLLGYKILLDIIISSSKKIKIREMYINFKSREKGFSKMRLKILLQLFLFLLIKFITK